MKKRIAKSISILSLLVLLSVGATNVSAFPSGSCTGVGCRPRAAVKTAAQNVLPAPAQDLAGQGLEFTEPAEGFFSFEFLLVRLAMSFLYLP